MTKDKKKVTKSKESKKVDKKIDMLGTGDQSYKKNVGIILVVLVLFGIFYLITAHITNDDSSTTTSDTSSTEIEIQYDEILVGSSFDMNDKEYIVVYYDKSDSELLSSISGSITTYTSKEDSLNVYEADLSNSFNKKFVDDVSNSSPSSSSELSFNGPTLIKFSDGKVVDYIEGEDSILDYLG